MCIKPFQLGDVLLPNTFEAINSPTESVSFVEFATQDGGFAYQNKPRISTRTFQISGKVWSKDECGIDKEPNPKTFHLKLNRLRQNREVFLFGIRQDSKIFKLKCRMGLPEFTPLSDDLYTYRVTLTALDPEWEECTQNIYLDTKPNENTLSAQWIKPKMTYTDLNLCNAIKYFYQPFFDPLDSTNINNSFNNIGCQTLTDPSQSLIVNPYYNFDCELYMKWKYNETAGYIDVEGKRIDCPNNSLDPTQPDTLVVFANKKIYQGSNYWSLKQIGDFDNKFLNGTSPVISVNSTTNTQLIYKIIERQI